MGNANSPALISKFMSRLRPVISDKIVEHRFNTLMDCYASVQLAEANIESRNVERACARNPRNNRKMTQRGSSGWQALGQQGGGSSYSRISFDRGQFRTYGCFHCGHQGHHKKDYPLHQ